MFTFSNSTGTFFFLSFFFFPTRTIRGYNEKERKRCATSTFTYLYTIPFLSRQSDYLYAINLKSIFEGFIKLVFVPVIDVHAPDARHGGHAKPCNADPSIRRNRLRKFVHPLSTVQSRVERSSPSDGPVRLLVPADWSHHEPQPNYGAAHAAGVHDDECRGQHDPLVDEPLDDPPPASSASADPADAALPAAAEPSRPPPPKPPGPPPLPLSMAPHAARRPSLPGGSLREIEREEVHKMPVPELPDGQWGWPARCGREEATRVPRAGMRQSVREDLSFEGASEMAHGREAVRLQLAVLRQEVHQERRVAASSSYAHGGEEVRLPHVREEVHEERPFDETRENARESEEEE